MPSGPRIRTDNVFGTTTDNPLTAGATTMNSAGLANLAAVSSAHAIIVLDPLRSAGAPEAVIVTAHTGSATSATITRGAYGTSAREHASGTLWVHAPTREDFIRIVTASTRPSDPYEGQVAYETDTNRWIGYDGATWRPSPHNPPAVSLTHSTTQALNDNTEISVTWDTESYDTDSMHAGGSPTRITFTTAGAYLVTWSFQVSTDNDYTAIYSYLQKNGSGVLVVSSSVGTFATASFSPQISGSYQGKFAAADFVLIRALQKNTSAGNSTITATGNHFAACWLGPGA